jgi:hypothetical protein
LNCPSTLFWNCPSAFSRIVILSAAKNPRIGFCRCLFLLYPRIPPFAGCPIQTPLGWDATHPQSPLDRFNRCQSVLTTICEIKPENTDPDSPIWLLGDSPSANNLDKNLKPLDRKHPTRHTIWTPILDVVQRHLFVDCGCRLDDSELFIRNAVSHPDHKLRINREKQETEIAELRELLTDMRNHTRELNLESPEALAAALKRLNIVDPNTPSLKQVRVFALGVDCARQNSVYWQELQRFWRRCFGNTGASLDSLSVLREMPSSAIH